MTTRTQQPSGWSDRVLTKIEDVGNKIPEPFTLFLILFGLTGLVSTGMALGDIEVTVPGSSEGPVQIRGLFTGEGMTWLTANLGANYVGFPPLKTVITILLAVGVAEKTGMLAAVVRRSFGSAPRWLLPYVVGLIGVTASVMADSSFIVVPPLAALVFKAAGRHPLAGLLGGFAAVGAGYSTALVPTSLDALFAGITTAVMESLPGLETATVTPVSNYYFNITSALMLGAIAGFVIDKVLEPRLVRQGAPREYAAAGAGRSGSRDSDSAGATTSQEDEVSAELSTEETRALKVSIVAGALLTVVILVAVLLPSSPWRNEDGGFLPESPLLDSVVFIVFAYFMVMGIAYGKVVGTVTGVRDVVSMMAGALTDMIGFLVLAFILGQFIALFAWTGIGSWIAVEGATLVEAAGLTGFPAVLGFMLLASVLNLFIISGSSMWTLMGAVFVPLFAILGLEPAFTQAAFRVGDSATQIITPLNPYMIVLLGLLRRYEPEAGFGTIMARLIPFVIPFWLAWAGLVGLWYGLDLPLGPGNSIFLTQE